MPPGRVPPGSLDDRAGVAMADAVAADAPTSADQLRRAAGGYDRFTILVLAIAAPLTISSPAVLLYGIPRPSLLSVPFTLYMLARLRGRIRPAYVWFSVAYLVALLPGTLIQLVSGTGAVKPAAAAQALFGLLTFATLASYFQRWLENCPVQKQKRHLLLLLILYGVFSLIELSAYSQITEARLRFYPTTFSDVERRVMIERELRLYGGRPTGFFSEASHFARFVALIAAAYMIAARNSATSLLLMGAVALVSRSISFLFATPAIAASLAYVWGARPHSFRAALRQLMARMWLYVLAAGAITGAIGYSQWDRIEDALRPTQTGATVGSEDGSFNARVLFPLDYALNRNESPLFGMGITPQDKIQADVLATERSLYRWKVSEDYMEGISASVVLVVGMGGVGTILFLVILVTMLRTTGLLMFVSFVAVNMLSSGYNSVASFVPSALLLAMVVYCRNQGDREAFASPLQADRRHGRDRPLPVVRPA